MNDNELEFFKFAKSYKGFFGSTAATVTENLLSKSTNPSSLYAKELYYNLCLSLIAKQLTNEAKNILKPEAKLPFFDAADNLRKSCSISTIEWAIVHNDMESIKELSNSYKTAISTALAIDNKTLTQAIKNLNKHASLHVDKDNNPFNLQTKIK